MLVHRVAAFFGLEHNVDQSGTLRSIAKSFREKLAQTRLLFVGQVTAWW